MIEKKKVIDLLDSIIEIKDKLSWKKLDSVGMYQARFPNGEYFTINIGESEDKLFFGKWIISSADYAKIYDLVKIADKYFQDKEEEEGLPYFKELKSLVDNLKS